MVLIKRKISNLKFKVMNNAKSFLFAHLQGLSITFKPVEKGKDRPVQTMKFGEFQQGQFGLEVDTTITYTTKNSSTPTTARRFLSIARALEYVAQAAEQTYMDAENLPVAAPGGGTDDDDDEAGTSVLYEQIMVEEAEEVKPSKKNRKQLRREAAMAAAN